MKRYLIILFAALWLAGCEKTPTPEPIDPDSKTFIMFGKISGFTNFNVPDARKAVVDGALIKGQRLVIYEDNTPGARRDLYELVRDPSVEAGYREVLIRSYDRTVSSMNPERMRQILEDAMAAAPANHYGLSIGSHGSGWLPVGYNLGPQARHLVQPFIDKLEQGGSLTRTTRNVNLELGIEELADVLDGLGLELVIFDQCLMGGVEVVYELRHAAPHLIVSPAEVMMYGFPYTKVLKTIFSDWGNWRRVCRDFIDFYGAHPDNPYGTIALVETARLDPLASAMRSLVDAGVNDVAQTGLQIFFRTGIFYDMGQYVERLAQDQALYEAFVEELDRAVIYKDHTGRFYSGNTSWPINHYSGLTTYVPRPDLYPQFYAAYRQTSWYRTVFGE